MASFRLDPVLSSSQAPGPSPGPSSQTISSQQASQMAIYAPFQAANTAIDKSITAYSHLSLEIGKFNQIASHIRHHRLSKADGDRAMGAALTTIHAHRLKCAELLYACNQQIKIFNKSPIAQSIEKNKVISSKRNTLDSLYKALQQSGNPPVSSHSHPVNSHPASSQPASSLNSSYPSTSRPSSSQPANSHPGSSQSGSSHPSSSQSTVAAMLENAVSSTTKQ